MLNYANFTIEEMVKELNKLNPDAIISLCSGFNGDEYILTSKIIPLLRFPNGWSWNQDYQLNNSIITKDFTSFVIVLEDNYSKKG